MGFYSIKDPRVPPKHETVTSMSRFKKRHLDALNDSASSYSSPLAVIVHIDLDAYYAQCEQVRLGMPPETPVVCRQWHSLIAVNYPARKFGIKRGDRIDVAKEKCPELQAPHVATYKKGETKWAWHDNPTQQEHKVSLDPFRAKSRKIFKVFKDYCSVIEKAGIDEAFFDLGNYLHEKLIEDFPNLAGLDREDDLPPPPSLEQIGLEWNGHLVGNEMVELNDWDDVCVLLASHRVAEIRSKLFEVENVTCSAGIARNKILAKLGSGTNKPNQQTIVTTATVLPFLQQFSLTDMWGMGGKFGDSVMQALAVPEGANPMVYLQSLDLDTMRLKLGRTEGQRVYNLARGCQFSELITRTDVKSMQSVKQFSAGALKTADDCHQWIKVFSADLANRVLELDDELPQPIRPKTVVLAHGAFGQVHSKQQAFPNTLKRNVTFEQYSKYLYDAGMALLDQVVKESGQKVVPCTMMRMAVTSMENVGGNTSLEGFFGKSSLMIPSKRKSPLPSFSSSSPPPPKQEPEEEVREPDQATITSTEYQEQEQEQEHEEADDGLFVTDETLVTCDRCKKQIECQKLDEHKDWHFARDLQMQDRAAPQPPPPKRAKVSPKTTVKKTAKDQSILKFFGKQ